MDFDSWYFSIVYENEYQYQLMIYLGISNCTKLMNFKILCFVFCIVIVFPYTIASPGFNVLGVVVVKFLKKLSGTLKMEE